MGGLRFAICGCSLIGLLLTQPARGQDTNVFIPDGGYAPDAALEAMRYMVSNAAAQFGEMMATNLSGSNDTDQASMDGSSTNEPADTNLTSETPAQDRSLHHESRSQWLDRQRARQASAVASAQARDGGSSGGPAIRDDTPARPDYSAFRLVNDRNIFDPNRVPHMVASNRPRERTARVESFSLVGTMSYEKGTFAFFDGTSSGYRKALKNSDNIAGYKVTAITPDTVKLASGTNQVELRVGMSMRSEEGGPWMPSTQSQAYADTSATGSPPVASASSSSSASPAPASGANESDIAKRMMQRREQE